MRVYPSESLSNEFQTHMAVCFALNCDCELLSGSVEVCLWKNKTNNEHDKDLPRCPGSQMLGLSVSTYFCRCLQYDVVGGWSSVLLCCPLL